MKDLLLQHLKLTIGSGLSDITLSFIAESIFLNYSENSPNFGDSKYSGDADLPDSLKDKIDMGKFYFVSQLNFSELQEFNPNNNLPPKGIVYFFCKIQKANDGYPYLPNDDFRVLYFENDPRKNIPTTGYKFEFTLWYTFPTPNQFSKEFRFNSYDDRMNFDNALNNFREQQGVKYSENRILGHPIVFNDYPWYSCISASIRGDKMENETKEKIIDEIQENLILLFQCSYPPDEMSLLYFGILPDDLKNGNFDRVYMEVQGS
jgi:uncharacterized protein YwqG